MRSLRYLNSVLTVIAVLLTLNLYTMWTVTGPEVATEAQAQGIPNAGAQRAETLAQLKLLNKTNLGIYELLKTGKARVRVEGAGDDKPESRQ